MRNIVPYIWLSWFLRACNSSKLPIRLPAPYRPPACKDCVHFQPFWMISHVDYAFSRCAKFETRDSQLSNNYADTCRNDETRCGKHGTHFQKK